MKYAIVVPVDQTVAYLSHLGDLLTTNRRAARLFESEDLATEVAAQLGEDAWLELVCCEAAFVGGGSTW